jgi:gluconolactonase
VFASSPTGAADGLAVDAEGGVWVALGSPGGVARFTPDGNLDRVLEIEADFVASVCFDGDVLYVATGGDGGGICRLTVDVPGLELTPAAV